MKNNQITSKETSLSLKFLISLFFLSALISCAQNRNKVKKSANYIVAAYVWPSCHDEPMSHEKLWSEGIGEWEMIQKGNPRFEGHYQPRIPLWGYKMDNDPIAWEQKIEAATAHGVNTFIFDWYWYDGKPFLEETIDKGFLGAINNQKANFYLMWANHDVPGNMWNYYRYKTDSLIWEGEVDWDNFKIIVDRVIDMYFKQPNYLKIDGNPVFSIYSLTDLVNSFKGLDGTKKALNYFRGKVKDAGFPDLHLQFIVGEGVSFRLLREEYGIGKTFEYFVSALNANSVTMYNMASRSKDHVQDYLKYGEEARKVMEKWDSILNVPLFPTVSVGWDDTPRRPLNGIESVCHYHNTPQSFGALLQNAKEFADNHPEQPKIIVINAWNEWVEGSYLEPDMLNGYGYLEAVKKVMSGKYEK